MLNRLFWKGKKVFLTGHTGFKGSWMLTMLRELGASCTGYALTPPTDPSLFKLIDGEKLCRSIIGDIRDLKGLREAMYGQQPDIVIHMAAQPLVIEGYKHPVDTFETNVMGTVNILEAVRGCESVKAVVNVTTDKVYENNNVQRGYEESDRLGGFDPYSNSKSCSELVTQCYKNSFFSEQGSAGIATVRAGNVLGGGDFAENRLLPDCVRAALSNERITIRNGSAVRPWQHVLEPVAVYLATAENIATKGRDYCTSFNIGPLKADCRPVLDVIKLFCEIYGEGMEYTELNPLGYHEAQLLILSAEKAQKMLGFKQRYDLRATIEKVVDWTKAYKAGKDMQAETIRQAREYLEIVCS